MNKETYKAKGRCTNCERRNHPQWGEYEIGKKIESYPCPQCGCMTWVPDFQETDNDVGKTSESIY